MKAQNAMMTLHSNLPRQGPGSDATTVQAIKLLPPLAKDSRVFDMGCGPGRSTLTLARELNTTVTAVDLQPEFLAELKARARNVGLEDKVQTRVGDMSKLNEPLNSIDLMWAEGSVYTIGFDNALALWLPMLKPNGLIACTELSWLNDTPPVEAKAFWQSNYPAMRSLSENKESAGQLGYIVVNTFILPASCWWDEYYTPMFQRIKDLSEAAEKDQSLATALQHASEEIATYEKYGDSYGYVFYLLQKRP